MQSNCITIFKTEFQCSLCLQSLDFIFTILCVPHLIHSLPFSGILEKVSFFVLKTHSWPARQQQELFSIGALAAVSKIVLTAVQGPFRSKKMRYKVFLDGQPNRLETSISFNNSVATEYGIHTNCMPLYKSLCSGKSKVWHPHDKFIAFSYFLPVQMQLSMLRLFFIISNAFELQSGLSMP